MKQAIAAFSILIAAAAPTLGAASSEATIISDLAPYVYPKNSAPVPERPCFAPDGSYLRLTDDGMRIERCDLASGSVTETVMDVATTREGRLPGKIEKFILSPDGTKILVATGVESIYRHSYRARWYVFQLKGRLLHPLSETQPTQRAPLFSPDGRMVAFTGADNNIYLHKIDFGTEVPVTKDGAIDRVINGVPDWVYEEEFATDCSMAWAPDNQTLCYLKYTETDVPAYTFTLYEGTCDPRPQYALYPGSFTYKYPVAGQPNSVVTLHSYNVDNRKNFDISLSGVPDMEYIPRIAYGGDDPSRLMVVTLNREQNHMELLSVNPRSGVSRSVLSEKSEAWLPTATYEQLTFEADGFTVLSARTGYQHAYRYSYAGAQTATLTSGDYNVTAYYGADLKGNRYVQTTSTGSINRVITRIDPKGVARNLTEAEGWSSAWFNPDMTACCLTYSSSATPPVSTLANPVNGKVIRTIDDGSAIAARYPGLPAREFTTITTDEGVTLNAYVIKPTGFDPSRRYPVILTQYSGPGSQEVVNRWKVDWTQYAAKQGYVVLCVDPRGTGGKDRDFETAVYKRLGELETTDLRGAVRKFARESYVDADRIAVTGWSYGGYETLMACTATFGGSNPFAAAVAIAPVTDWRYYDTIYAERYMLTPGQNGDGYTSSAPLSYAANLDIPLLIIHGTADDNVHLMNTMQYVSVMQQAGRLCDMLLYPDMNHSINGCDARLSVYSKMLRYIDRALGVSHR